MFPGESDCLPTTKYAEFFYPLMVENEESMLMYSNENVVSVNKLLCCEKKIFSILGFHSSFQKKNVSIYFVTFKTTSSLNYYLFQEKVFRDINREVPLILVLRPWKKKNFRNAA